MKLLLLPLLAVLLLTIVLSVIDKRHNQVRLIRNDTDVALYLAEDLKGLLATAHNLDESFSAFPSDPESTAAEYRKFLQAILDTCASRQYSAQSTAIKDSTLRGFVERNDRLCADLTVLSGQSKKQFDAVNPMLELSSTPRRYASFPVISTLLESHINKQVDKSLANIKALESSSQDDGGARNGLKIIVSETAENIRLPQSSTQLLQTIAKGQQQLLAVRIDYWSSFIGISSLHKELQSQLNNTCTYVDQIGASSHACAIN